MGNRWPTYEAYFRFVQDEWSMTQPEVRDSLSAHLIAEITAAGTPVVTEFPLVNKIVELCALGRYHPGWKR